MRDLYPADKYSVSAEAVTTRIGGVCAARPVALRAVLTQLLYAWLTGNGDLHAKKSTIDQVLIVTAGMGDELAGEVLPFDQRRGHDLVQTLRRRRQELV